MNTHLPTLNLIGAGRVGQTLARLWTQAGVFAVQDVLTTSMATARSAASSCARLAAAFWYASTSVTLNGKTGASLEKAVGIVGAVIVNSLAKVGSAGPA